jgi:hypothetical protein
MSERNDLKKAMDLAIQGKRGDARTLVLSLEPHIKEPRLRLHLIDVALSVLDSVKDNATKALLSDEGARIAQALGRADLQAHFMAKMADFAMLQVGMWHHDQSMLKLAPRWFQFATETDKNEYESLTTLIGRSEMEIDALLSRAVALSEKSGDKKIQASVLMSMGSIESARYLRFKMDCMRGVRAKIWSRFDFARYPFFEYLLTVWNGDAKKLNAYVKSFTNRFLKAARLSEEIDDVLAGYAYHNLAIHLKSAYRFGAARRCLAKARAIALKHNDAALLLKLNALEGYIKAKNRDIPDYLSGETRETS